MVNKIKYSLYYNLNSRQLNLFDFGLKINNKNPNDLELMDKIRKFLGHYHIPFHTLKQQSYFYNMKHYNILDKLLINLSYIQIVDNGVKKVS